METAWTVAADIALAILVALAVTQPNAARPWRDRLRGSLPRFMVALVAVGLAVTGKAVEVWPGHPEFPSGHMSFIAALGTTLLLDARRVAAPLLGLWLLAGAGLVGAGFHTVAEVLGGFMLGALTAAIAHGLLLRGWRSRQEASPTQSSSP